jgi:Tol biopolymer transport system component
MGDPGPGQPDDDVWMARKLAALLFCLLALPSSAGAGTIDYGRIAFVSDRDGNNEIYSTRIDAPPADTNLTQNSASDQSPAYSADGSKIAFVSDRDGRMDVWVINWDGSAQRKVTTGDPGSSDSSPSWSPDGRQIVFSSTRGGSTHLWVVAAGEGTLRQLTSGPGISPAWSPDGSRIAYASDGSIRVVDVSGGNDHQLAYCVCTGPADSPTWSGDSRFVFFARYDDDWQSTNVRQLYVVSATGGEPFPVTSGAYNYDRPTFSPTGSVMAFQRQDAVGGSEELYLQVGTSQFPVVTAPGRNFSPSWGPKPVDLTAPTITLTRPTADIEQIDVYTVGQVVLADYSCTDSGSGVRHCEGTVPSGQPIDTRSIGTYDFFVFAADQDGNPVYQNTRYTVIYPFEGFATPIDKSGLTDLRAGDGVPLKFSLHGPYGLDAVAGTTQQPIDCATRSALDSPAAAIGTLTYNSSQDRYMFAWATTKSWAGGCHAITVSLRDGTTHRADIRFTK